MSEKKPSTIAAISLVTVFFVSRVIHLIFLNPYHFSVLAPEERYVGTIAVEILNGLHFPFLDYQANTYLGGSLFMGLFASLIFKVLGPSFFALKLSALLLSSLTLYLWYLLITRYFGEGIARVFAILYIFSPPSFTQFTVTTLGSHTEAMFFTAVSIYLTFEIITQRKTSPIYSILLGFFLGFGIWFSYVNLLTLIAIIIFWLVMDRNSLKGHVFSVLSGLLIGISPWLLYNFNYQMSGFVIYEKSVWDHFELGNVTSIFQNYRDFVGYHMFISLGKPIWGLTKEQILFPAFTYSLIYLIPVGICCAGLLKKKSECNSHQKSPAFRFILLFSVLYLGVTQLSSFRSARYFIPLYPVLFLLVSLVLHRAENQFPKLQFKLIPILCLLLVIAMPITHAFLYSPKYMGQVFQTKGYAYQNLHVSLCKDPQPCLEKYDELYQDMARGDFYDLSTELAIHVASQMPIDGLKQKHDALIKQLPERFLIYFYYFLGQHLLDRSKSLEDALSQSRNLELGEKDQLQLVRGILDQWGLAHSSTPAENKAIIELPDPLIQTYWRALGERISRANLTEPIDMNKVMDILDVEAQEATTDYNKYFLEGFGKFLYDKWSQRPLKPLVDLRLVKELPKKWQTPVLMGIGMGIASREYIWRIADASWYWQETTTHMTAEDKALILKGKEVATAIFDPIR